MQARDIINKTCAAAYTAQAHGLVLALNWGSPSRSWRDQYKSESDKFVLYILVTAFLFNFRMTMIIIVTKDVYNSSEVALEQVEGHQAPAQLLQYGKISSKVAEV